MPRRKSHTRVIKTKAGSRSVNVKATFTKKPRKRK